MGALIINLLWLLIYSIVFCGVVYLVLYGIKRFIYPIPDRLEQGVWFIAFVLVLIAFVSTIIGQPVVHAPVIR